MHFITLAVLVIDARKKPLIYNTYMRKYLLANRRYAEKQPGELIPERKSSISRYSSAVYERYLVQQNGIPWYLTKNQLCIGCMQLSIFIKKSAWNIYGV